VCCGDFAERVAEICGDCVEEEECGEEGEEEMEHY
jgi:hypothetical protein